MKPMLDCPFCMSDSLEVVKIEGRACALSVRCKKCGATGPCSFSADPARAMFAWNERVGEWHP